MVDAPVVGGHIASVQKQSLLDCRQLELLSTTTQSNGNSRLLKLLMGVEISTRPVNKSGSEGNRASRTSRKRRAAPNTAAFLRLADMVNSPWRVCSVGCRELRRWPIGVHGPPPFINKFLLSETLLRLHSTLTTTSTCHHGSYQEEGYVCYGPIAVSDR